MKQATPLRPVSALNRRSPVPISSYTLLMPNVCRLIHFVATVFSVAEPIYVGMHRVHAV